MVVCQIFIPSNGNNSGLSLLEEKQVIINLIRYNFKPLKLLHIIKKKFQRITTLLEILRLRC